MPNRIARRLGLVPDCSSLTDNRAHLLAGFWPCGGQLGGTPISSNVRLENANGSEAEGRQGRTSQPHA